ncbi:unnamed protein product [Microthlaspi erraticum]|uniref:Major facilitator superfamily (MFS) profile domain-containing protein n=1 Tax=Microthlaspi erraticum TaxID=1685480 RepID=A0A6D2HRR6_9BRAS|nr:unnamed protein product [Microthlaspi erraticum]
MLVQPTVGYYSDRCTSRFGRRRPFIAVGAALVAVAGILIGYAADLGRLAGDNLEKTPKVRAIWFFALGFWILDVANNTLQGPCRAFLADLSQETLSKLGPQTRFSLSLWQLETFWDTLLDPTLTSTRCFLSR